MQGGPLVRQPLGCGSALACACLRRRRLCLCLCLCLTLVLRDALQNCSAATVVRVIQRGAAVAIGSVEPGTSRQQCIKRLHMFPAGGPLQRGDTRRLCRFDQIRIHAQRQQASQRRQVVCIDQPPQLG